MKRWEYLFLEMPVNGRAFLPDEYGRKGWELVAVLSATPAIDRMWFKRPTPPRKIAKRRAAP